MKISDLIEELETIKAEYGDIPCLIEVCDRYSDYETEVDRVVVEDADNGLYALVKG